MFALVRGGNLVVKLPAFRAADLVADGSAKPFQVGTRVMREWVEITGPRRSWPALAREALAFVGG